MSSGSPTETARTVRFGLDPARLAERLRFFAIEPEDQTRLAALGPVRAPIMDELIDTFYAHLLRFPPLASMLGAAPGLLDRVKQLQREYFLGLTSGRIDADYVEGRLRVGETHARIGLEPSWYIGAFGLYLRLWLQRLLGATGMAAESIASIDSLVKLVTLDISFAMDTYIGGGFVARQVADTFAAQATEASDALLRLQSEDQAKSELAAMVVHDLKNPVSGILMLVRLALRKGQDLPAAHRGYLLQIDRTCHEMLRLIQNLLEIAKLEEGKLPVACEPLDVGDLVADVAREYGPIAEEQGRRLHVRLSPALAAHGDAALLKRVLVNLVVNALRHSGSNEVIVDGSMSTTVTPAATIRVVDHGRGIPPDLRHRLFKPFTSDPSRRDAVGVSDTGLGLPFCKLAIERMGGRIAVEDTPGGGTTFTVILPTAPLRE